MTNKIIQGLWIGSNLTTMERLTISSYLKNNHEFHLYAYDEVESVPTGALVKDGNEILPASMIFQYRDQKSYSAFSNFFRYKLLFERGGWWVDMDAVCLKHFDFKEEHVFSSEPAQGKVFTSSGYIKAPRRSGVMDYAWQRCVEKNPDELVWGEVGPKLVAEAVKKYSLEHFIKPPEVFCPVGYAEWQKVLDPKAVCLFGETTYALHLWNEMWRRNGQDKDSTYHPDCIYEQLKKRYL